MNDEDGKTYELQDEMQIYHLNRHTFLSRRKPPHVSLGRRTVCVQELYVPSA